MFLVRCEELRINHLTSFFVVTMPYACWFLWRAYYIEDFKWHLHFNSGLRLEGHWRLQSWTLVQVDVDHTGHFWHRPSTFPAIIIWKVVSQHLFLNIIPNNSIARTGRKVSCDRGLILILVPLLLITIFSNQYLDLYNILHWLSHKCASTWSSAML
jgi:hypothetical protein